jgi:hypothetical protein
MSLLIPTQQKHYIIPQCEKTTAKSKLRAADAVAIERSYSLQAFHKPKWGHRLRKAAWQSKCMQKDLTVALLVKKLPVIVGYEGSYRVHKGPRLDPILNQMIPVQTPPPYFFNVYFNVILLATSTVVASAMRP